MASSIKFLFIIFFSLFCLSQLSGVYAATFTIVNKCSYTIWPGILSSAGTNQLDTTGFTLLPSQSNIFNVPTSWSGRLWARTYCSQDSSGKFSCATADCGSGTIECHGAGAAPPATLAEFTLNGAGGLDFYDVSLVDGYNLAMLVEPEGGQFGNCTTTGCAAELNKECPLELRVMGGEGNGESVACKSACGAFGEARYCCSGDYGNPNTCKPTSYSEFFKKACPLAYSYAYDDGTSTFTCGLANYVITFCPSPSTSLKSSNGQSPEADNVTGSSHSTSSSMFLGIVATVLAAIWRLL